jgi:Uncharacterised nucleotidyltransferase
VTGSQAAARRWPTAEQELLLRAALCPAEPGLRAWRAWRRAVDLQTADPESATLIPLVYQNLRRAGSTDPELGLYRGAYRKTWYHNQILLRGLSALLGGLANVGLRTMVLNGAPLVERYYPGLGARSIADGVILVRPVDALRSLACARRLGWRSEPAGPPLALLAASPGLRLLHPTHQAVELRWFAWPGRRGPSVDDDLWAAARPGGIAELQTLMPCPADQLLLTCAEPAERWAGVPAVGWVADALLLLAGAAEALDWERVRAQAGRLGRSEPARASLGYLRDHFDAPLPAGLVESLRPLRVRDGRRPAPDGVPLAMRALRSAWRDYGCFVAAETKPPARLLGFARYLQAVKGVPRLWQVPLILGYRGLRRLVGRGPLRRRREA